MSRRVTASDAGVFPVLADPQRFAQVGIKFGAVWSPSDVDFAPDAMPAELKQKGC